MKPLNLEKVTLEIGARGGHYYKPESKPECLYPSVTTILSAVLAKPALLPWARKVERENIRKAFLGVDIFPTKDMWAEFVNGTIDGAKNKPEEIAGAAADIGTRAHGVIDDILKGTRKGTLDGLDEDIKPSVGAFLEWWQTQKIKVLHSELPVCSHKLQVGGGMDFLGWKDRGLVVGDWKTSSGIYGSMLYQVGAYALCVEEMTGKKVKSAFIARFPKVVGDVPFEVVEVPSLAGAKMGFCYINGLYQLNKKYDAYLKECKKSDKEAKKIWA